MNLKRDHKNRQSGNVLFLILVAIALLGIITAIISNYSSEQKETLDRQTTDAQVSVLFNHTATLGVAVMNLLIQGVEPNNVYQVLSTLKQGDAGFEDSPHQYKLYHPLGGGVSYTSSTSNTASEAIATNFNINKKSIVIGVGKSDNAVDPADTVGDILFTARITNSAYCAAINKKINGRTSIPEMADAAFNSLFNDGTTVVIDTADCSDCVNNSRFCVRNSSDSQWGFYSALFPG